MAKLGDGPLSNVVALVESHGAWVTTTALADSLDSFSRWHNGRPVIVEKLDQYSAVRRRFNIAHELGHLVLHWGVSEADMENRDAQKEIERQANQFSAAFLMPAATFGLEFYSTGIEYLSHLKLRWKCSIQSMAM